MLTATRRFGRLSHCDRLIVVETIALALPIEVGLRCLSLDALVSRLGRLGQESSEQGPALDVERIARLVDATTAFHPLNQTCLKKSLILLRILRRRGIRAELHLGVRKVDEQFSAHAWVAYEGRIVLGGDIADLFTPLPLMGLARAPHVRRT